MLCIHCGAENSVTAIFCQKCGKRLETTEQNEPTLLSPSGEPASPYENLFYTVPDSSGPIYPPPPPGIPYGSTSTSDQPSPSPPRRRLSAGLTSLIVGVVFLLIAGSGVIYYTTVFQPN